MCRYENLNAQIQKKSILAHVGSYDYAAALTVAEWIRPLLSVRAYELLKAPKLMVNWGAYQLMNQKIELALAEL